MLKESVGSAQFDEIFDRPAYITDIKSFLDESDHFKALSYWLSNFVAPARLKKPKDIIFAIQQSIADIDHLIND